MGLLALYLGVTFAGVFLGKRVLPRDKEFTWSGKIQTVAAIALVFVLGTRIGANEKVVESLGSIGLIAFALTIFAMAGSVLTVVASRKLLGINKRGERENE